MRLKNPDGGITAVFETRPTARNAQLVPALPLVSSRRDTANVTSQHSLLWWIAIAGHALRSDPNATLSQVDGETRSCTARTLTTTAPLRACDQHITSEEDASLHLCCTGMEAAPG